MQHRQAVADSLDRRLALCQFAGHKMRDSFSVGFGLELVAFRLKHGAKFGEILDDAVMNNRKALGDVRMGVTLHRLAVRRPAGMANTDDTRKRFSSQSLLQIDQLAFGTAAIELAVLQGGDTGRIVAAIFKPLQCIHEKRSDFVISDNADNSTHGLLQIRRRDVMFRGLKILTQNGNPMDCRSLKLLDDLFRRGFSRFDGGILLSQDFPRPSFVSCRARPKASASAGTLSVIVLPDAI